MWAHSASLLKEELTTEAQRFTEKLRVPLCLCGSLFFRMELFLFQIK